jgi:glycosyltransferase involved in cell wall biosynthesis
LIVGVDATTLRGRISGVGYYTARLVESLANGAGEGVLDRIVVLSNRQVSVPAGERIEVYVGRRCGVRSVWMQFLLPGILREIAPDVVHYTNYLAPLAGETPYVVSVHDMSLSIVPRFHTLKKRLLTSRLLPLVARGARLVLVPSESTRRDVVRLLGIDPGRVRVIPYAASPSFRPAGNGGCAPYFLYVGTLEPRKNLARALRAFARVADALPDHRFVIVGQPGWKYGEILREAGRPELRSRVELRGYVDEEELPGLYGHAVAFVYPSLYEGFGLPVMEAMACGTPVLTSRTSSLREIAEGAALLVDPLDEAALAAGLHALATDSGLRADLSARGLGRAASYSWERTGRETVAAYEEAVDGGRARARRLLPPPTQDADRAIVRTVTYAGLFQAPLTVERLHRTLMDVRLDLESLRRRLEAPALRDAVALTDGLVHPRGREEWVELRRQRQQRTRELIERHRFGLQGLARFPFVRLVALSGACAHDNAADDDVDVFLIVKRDRAWCVCLSLMVLSKLLGWRRSFCLNYIVDEQAVQIPETDLFTASEIVGMKPLAGRSAYRRLVGANAWIAARFPNFYAGHVADSQDVPEVRPPAWLERILELGPGQLLEALSNRILGAYLRARTRGRPGVSLSPHRLKLHALDHGPRLIAAFALALGESGEAAPKGVH